MEEPKLPGGGSGLVVWWYGAVEGLPDQGHARALSTLNGFYSGICDLVFI